ncbi:kinase domain protein [Ceratobasidium sp. AG-Ba]|nr:kinase domain protein [Ceratobasidium sp. AG-Ba]QRV72196.1 kinase domain protein [Ceratobasidium sp. AG-Ba]QRW01235.1 kinase domain protein [Ceratobasidium sp. AG-Ba]QRW01242.1 kinase domain protein [Ceratobasidium sp. AG-Ba]
MSHPPTQPFHAVNATSSSPEERSDAEKRWVSFQPYLHSKGYQLRARYQPDWVPSWTITGANPRNCEDRPDVLPIRTLDATRLNDQRQVIIKMLAPSDEDREGEDELKILQFFSSSPYSDDPSNHIVPCLDSFPIPGVENGMFFVMPLLSDYKSPPFYDLSEIHDFLTQLFEGLEFLHRHDVAHCDIAPDNILMDKRPLLDEPFHPFRHHRSLDGKRIIRPKYLRSQRPVRYYYIDFGFAAWFRDPTTPRTAHGVHAKEKAPEQVEGATYDPFKVDIYQLGAVLRRDLIPKYESLNFLLSLARDMTNQDPQKRPTIQSAQRTMHTHFAGLSGWRTRWPLIPPDASFQQWFAYTISGLATEFMFMLRRALNLIFLQC